MKIIKNIREQLGFTQAELASTSGLSLRTIQRLECNNTEPKGHTLKVLADVFKMEPKLLKEEFQNIGKAQASEKTSIQLINLSILAFIGIPFGNLIFPFILWWKNRKSKLVDEVGRRIINFQIIWWIIFSILLCLSPFIGRTFFSNTPIILMVLFLAYVINIIIVCRIAMKLQRNNFNFLNSPLRFI
ncbi:helix-turn-helix domain-containing protein [uncultured Winogradskyella sp.]|uniref:helix-turn-helix domain-containing protein n=1 Tax=uncultured Winogradskyella sp. TaxID=395353 RepID=UPI0026392C8B|nr:helix-turn-helix domain-containing protein [uncultured Winogradskyella sp.]